MKEVEGRTAIVGRFVTRVAALSERPMHLAVMVFVLALAVRLVFIATLEEKWYFYDTRHYDAAARSLLRGEGFEYGYQFFNTTTYNLEPLYPVFLAANYAVFGRVFWVVRVVQSVMGALTCVLVFFIGRKVFGVWAGVIAAGLCAFYPHLVFISGMLYPEQLFTMLIAGGVLLLLKFSETSRFRFVAWAGICLGLATLAKGILLAVFPLVCLWLMYVTHKSGWKYRIAGPAILCAIVIATLIPWTVRNYRIFGQLSLVRAHTNLVLEEEFATEEEGLLSQMAREGFNAGKFVKRYCSEFVKFWTPSLGRLRGKSEFANSRIRIVSVVATAPILLFAVIGLILSRKKLKKALLLVVVVLSFALAYSLWLTHVRYRIPVEPYLILFAAYGIYSLGDALRRKRAEQTHRLCVG